MIRQFVMGGNDLVICTGGVLKGERHEFENQNNPGESIYLFYAYTEDCSTEYLGEIFHDEGSFKVYGDTLYDMSFLFNKPFYGINTEKTGYWIAINPIPTDKRFNFEKINGPGEIELPASEKRRRVIVLNGTPKINNKDLSFLKVGNVAAGKTISLSLNFNDRILILEDI
jgi:hypothetical protein